MSGLRETREQRIKKLHELMKLGFDPYPSKVKRTHLIAQLIDEFEQLLKNNKTITVTGRVLSLRLHGGACFADFQDGSGRIQIFIKKDIIGSSEFNKIIKLIDPSDFLEISGTAFKTKRGELSVLSKKIVIIAKALRTIPETYYRLKNVETRLRKRYLDLAANEEIRNIFIKKAIFWKTIRDYMTGKGFLEVQTPVLENIPGGAEAEPFITHHNTLDRDFFLRISLELPLKRLLVGGYEKVFEIGRVFRNEGISTEHLQDYTQLEFYWAYSDYEDLMKFVEIFFKFVIKKTVGSLIVSNGGQEINFGKKWLVYDYYDEFKKFTKIDLNKAADSLLRNMAKKLGCKLEKYSGRGRIIDLIYKKVVRPNLINPGFLIDPPIEIEPLAKKKNDNGKRVQRMQVVAWGTELGKGFTELNNPLDQRERFLEQMELRKAGDKEAQMIDEDYLEAMEYGMPPNTGFGLSERLFSMIMDKPIRETVIFPPMKEEKPE